MTEGDLKAILVAGDVDACLAYFEHATEEERKAVASQALDWYAKQNANSMIAAWEESTRPSLPPPPKPRTTRLSGQCGQREP